MSDTADKIAKILEDPESIKMISEIAESFMSSGDPSDEGASTEDQKDEALTENSSAKEATAEATAKGEKLIPGELSSSMKLLNDIIGKGDVENSIRLISALRPYMSKHRRDNADSVLKWLKALKFIGKHNISEISKLFSLM